MYTYVVLSALRSQHSDSAIPATVSRNKNSRQGFSHGIQNLQLKEFKYFYDFI